MGTFTVNIQVGDDQGQTFEEAEALVDAGATFTVIPASTLRRLGVQPRRRVPFRLTNDQIEHRDVGVAVVRFDGHGSITSVVFGEEGTVLLGAVTMEDMLLTIDPINKRLVPVEGLLMLCDRKSPFMSGNSDRRLRETEFSLPPYSPPTMRKSGATIL